MGVAPETITAALLRENEARCQPPLAADDVARRVRDAVVYATTEETHRANTFSEFAKRPRLLDDGELEQLPAPTFQIDGLVPERGLVLLFAPPATGKSFLALDWAASIQTGKSWQGRQVRPGQAVYVSAEGASGMPVRIRAWKRRNEFEGVAGLVFCIEAVDVSKPTEVDKFMSALEGRPKPDLVVLDTVARCLSGDEDSAKDMGAFVAGAERLRTQLGATVLMVHHPTKKGDGERGSGALRAAVDTVLKLTAHKPTGLLRLELEKQKDGPIGEDIWMSLAPMQLSDRTSSCVLAPALAPQPGEDTADSPAKTKGRAYAKSLIIAVLTSNTDGLRSSELQSRIPGVADSTFNRALRELRQERRVVLENSVNRIPSTVTVTVNDSE